MSDQQQLENMILQYNMFKAKLTNPSLTEPERQSTRAALFMLESFMESKTRDIKRRMRDDKQY